MIRPARRLPAGEACRECLPVSERIVGRPVVSADGVLLGCICAGLGHAVEVQPTHGTAFRLPIETICWTCGARHRPSWGYTP